MSLHYLLRLNYLLIGFLYGMIQYIVILQPETGVTGLSQSDN